MLRNDNMPATAPPEPSNIKKCAGLKTVLARGREKSLPCIRRGQDVYPQMPRNTLPPPGWGPLQPGKNINALNPNAINSGMPLKRVYNVEKAEVSNPNFMKKGKKDKSKNSNRKQRDKSPNRDQLKKQPKTKEPVTPPQIKIHELTPQQRLEEKLRKRSTVEKALNDRRAVSQPAFTQPKSQLQPQPLLQPPPQPQPFNQRHPQPFYQRQPQPFYQRQPQYQPQAQYQPQPQYQTQPQYQPQGSYQPQSQYQPQGSFQPQPQGSYQPQPEPSPSDRKKSLESRLTTKIWQILNRDVFLLDHEKFNNQIQATNSETKKYIINVIKKCNNKQIKRLNRPKVTQTCKENCFANRYRDKKRALKIAVRRRVWALAKASIKRSKHWTQFLAENHIIVENINIDKFDLSLIDLDALGIENKLLKRTVTWLFN